MPKINHRRGETRESVYRMDSGTHARKRNCLGRDQPSRRGAGGLMKDHYEVFGTVRVVPGRRKNGAPSRRGWGWSQLVYCPCCVIPQFRRDLRASGSRVRVRRFSVRAIRRCSREIIRAAFEGYFEDFEDSSQVRSRFGLGE